jgi:hypothetical protein
MTTPQAPRPVDAPPTTIDAGSMDLTLLSGQLVTLFAEQMLGKPIAARVALVADRELVLDKSLGAQSLDNLVPHQRVVLRALYKGEQVHVPATLQRVSHGQVRLVLGRTLVALARRQFVRIYYQSPVQLAIVSTASFRRNRLHRLRWLETETENLSSGGALIRFSGNLMNPTHLLFHLGASEFPFPAMLLAQVLYSLPKTDSSFRIGLEFVTREAQVRQFSPVTLKEFPAPVRSYADHTRRELNRLIQEWLSNAKNPGA